MEELNVQLVSLYREFERQVAELYESLLQLHEIFQLFIAHLHELANAQLVNEAEFARVFLELKHLRQEHQQLKSLVAEHGLLV